MAFLKRESRVARLQGYAAGIQKYLSNGPPLTLNNQQITPAELVQRIQHCIDTSSAALTARGQYHDAVTAAKQDYAQLYPVLSAFRSFVIALYKGASQKLADFGIVLHPAKKPTSEAKAEAAVKTRATRTARNTLGKRQKATVKGNVPKPVQPADAPANLPAQPSVKA